MFTNRCLKRIILISAFLAGPETAYSQQSTYAELLGWPTGTKAVILHVDDAGMSHDSNMGAIKARMFCRTRRRDVRHSSLILTSQCVE